MPVDIEELEQLIKESAERVESDYWGNPSKVFQFENSMIQAVPGLITEIRSLRSAVAYMGSTVALMENKAIEALHARDLAREASNRDLEAKRKAESERDDWQLLAKARLAESASHGVIGHGTFLL